MCTSRRREKRFIVRFCSEFKESIKSDVVGDGQPLAVPPIGEVLFSHLDIPHLPETVQIIGSEITWLPYVRLKVVIVHVCVNLLFWSKNIDSLFFVSTLQHYTNLPLASSLSQSLYSSPKPYPLLVLIRRPSSVLPYAPESLIPPSTLHPGVGLLDPSNGTPCQPHLHFLFPVHNTEVEIVIHENSILNQ